MMPSLEVGFNWIWFLYCPPGSPGGFFYHSSAQLTITHSIYFFTTFLDASVEVADKFAKKLEV